MTADCFLDDFYILYFTFVRTQGSSLLLDFSVEHYSKLEMCLFTDIVAEYIEVNAAWKDEVTRHNAT